MAIASPQPRVWTFRPACEADVDELTRLHKKVFGKELSREQWRWKLSTQPGPVANVWVAEADGRIVFQYAGIPTRVRHQARDCWAMIDVDTMTDPAYRRQGLLTQGGATTYAHWRKAGIAYTFGLPNEQWGSRTNALGWVRLGELRWWVRWLDLVGLVAGKPVRSKRAVTTDKRRGDSLRIAYVDDPSPMDTLWTALSGEGVIRNAAWFRWRYLNAVPPWKVIGAWSEHELAGAVAFHIDSDPRRPSGLIGEVFASSFGVMRILLRASCRALRSLGAVRAALLIQPGSTLEEAALAAGFLPRRFTFPVEAVDLGGGLPRTAQFHGGDFDVV
jgi:hypothetical protein